LTFYIDVTLLDFRRHILNVRRVVFIKSWLCSMAYLLLTLRHQCMCIYKYMPLYM